MSSAISITINREPVQRIAFDAASDAAKLQSEIFERLIEMDGLHHDQGACLCRRLATLADLSAYAYRMVLHVGSGDLAGVLASYESMAQARGLTKQAVHYELNAELKKIAFLFPEISTVLHQYRDHATRHNRVQSDHESAQQATP
jgi:hypothetical protein